MGRNPTALDEHTVWRCRYSSGAGQRSRRRSPERALPVANIARLRWALQLHYDQRPPPNPRVSSIGAGGVGGGGGTHRNVSDVPVGGYAR
jgi:hypothetical protein